MALYFIRAQRALDNCQGTLYVQAADVPTAEEAALTVLRANDGTVCWSQVQPTAVQPMQPDEDFFLMDCLLVPSEALPVLETMADGGIEVMAAAAAAVTGNGPTIIPAAADTTPASTPAVQASDPAPATDAQAAQAAASAPVTPAQS